MRKKIIIGILTLIVAGIAAALVLRGRNHADANRILISGNIELKEINIAFKTAGRLVERTVDEGDPVQAGQVIARLDRDQLLRQREQADAALAAAKAQLAQAETAAHWQRETWQADVAQRRAEVETNEARLRELKNGARPQEIE